MDGDGSDVRQITHNTIRDEARPGRPTACPRSRAAPTTCTSTSGRWPPTAGRPPAHDLPRHVTSHPTGAATQAPGRSAAPCPPRSPSASRARRASGVFTPGIDREYLRPRVRPVTSTVGSATLSVSDPGHPTNGTFSLPQPLRVEPAQTSWTGPVANAIVPITFASRSADSTHSAPAPTRGRSRSLTTTDL